MGRSLQPGTAAIGDIRGNVGIVKGGTGQAAPEPAVEALGGMSKQKFGKPLGVAQLGIDGKVPVSQLDTAAVVANVALNGPVSLYAGQVAQYTITNFDSKTTYIVTTSAGTVSRTAKVITLTAPNTIGNITLTVNNRAITINVGSVRPFRPNLSVVSSNNNTVASAALTSSPYAAMQGTATHASSDWEIATNSTFSNVIKSSYNDAANKTSYNAAGLSLNTTYFARVRYKDSTGAVSDWSPTVSFISEDTLSSITEEAKLTANVKKDLARFGTAVAMSSDSLRVVVSAVAEDTSSVAGTTLYTGAVYIFLRTGNSWTQEARLVGNGNANSDMFGSSVSITADGSRVVIGARGEDTGSTNAGAVYVYLRTGNTWTQEAKIFATTPAINNNFGSSVSMSSDGSRIVVGAVATTTTQGSAYVYLRTDTAWALESALGTTDTTLGKLYGGNVSITADGTRAAISCSRFNPTSITDAGTVYVYFRTGNTWAQEAKIIANDKAVDDRFGSSICMSSDGNRIAIGAVGVDSNFNGVGAVYVFSRTGVTWTQEAKIVASDNIDSIAVGVSVSINSDGTKIITSSEVINAGRGAAYVFNRTGSSWTQEAKLIASDNAVSDAFGSSVSIGGDGFVMIIGASAEDPSNINLAGSAYIFS